MFAYGRIFRLKLSSTFLSNFLLLPDVKKIAKYIVTRNTYKHKIKIKSIFSKLLPITFFSKILK